MSRFHQRLREDLSDPEFADAFYDMSVDIALLQVLEQARKALNVSEKELAERMGVQRSTVTRLFKDTPRVRAASRDQNQPGIPRGCTYSH